MKIVDITTMVMQAGAPEETAWTGAGGRSALATGRNWLFVKVVTDVPGLFGIGEGSGWPRVVQTAIDDLKVELIGEDPRRIERLWQRMRLAMMGHGDTGVVGAGAITAIDMALWDIAGKRFDAPVSDLWGGRIRDRIRYYAHARSASHARALVAAGVTTVKIGGHARIVERACEIRDAVGPEIDIAVDLHGPPWLAAPDAIAIARGLAAVNPVFIEEPVAPEDLDGLRQVRRAVDTVPIASGERFATKWGALALIREGLVDIIQPDTGRAGGPTEMRKIAALAEAHFIQVAPHSGSLGPVAEFAAAHLMATIPNGLMMERLEPDWPGRDAVIVSPLDTTGGYVRVPDGPGLGVELDEAVVGRHPSTRNVAIASGGWQDPEDAGATYVAMRRHRSQLSRS